MKNGLAWLWLTVTLLVTGGAALIDLSVQQDYRQSANDPQIQIAQDLAATLKNQIASCDHLGPTIDINATLSPFVIVYDQNGKAINSCAPGTSATVTGLINGHLPTLPSGVISYALAHGQDRFTWQPSPGLRFAAVLTHFQGTQNGFVLAARSLHEIELRERQLNTNVLIALLAAYVVISIGFSLDNRHISK